MTTAEVPPRTPCLLDQISLEFQGTPSTPAADTHQQYNFTTKLYENQLRIRANSGKMLRDKKSSLPVRPGFLTNSRKSSRPKAPPKNSSSIKVQGLLSSEEKTVSQNLPVPYG